MTTEAQNGPQISLSDLQNAIKVIDYACEQGAFKGWEVIEQVREVRGRILTFVEAATPPQVEPVVETPVINEVNTPEVETVKTKKTPSKKKEK